MGEMVAGWTGWGEPGSPHLCLDTGASACHHPVEAQQQQRAEERGNPARALSRAVPAERAADEAADQRAGNAQQNRHDDATRVVSRHDQLGNGADNQTEENPAQNLHLLPPAELSCKSLSTSAPGENRPLKVSPCRSDNW